MTVKDYKQDVAKKRFRTTYPFPTNMAVKNHKQVVFKNKISNYLYFVNLKLSPIVFWSNRQSTDRKHTFLFAFKSIQVKLDTD